MLHLGRVARFTLSLHTTDLEGYGRRSRRVSVVERDAKP